VLDIVGDRSLTRLFDERVAAHPDRVLLVFEDSAGTVTELAYGDLADRVERFAGALAGIGVEKGDFVVVHLRNSPEIMVAWLALSRLGAVFVPSNVANTASELEHVIGFTGARLAITQPELLAPVEAAIESTGVGTDVIVARGDAGGHRGFDDLCATGGPIPDVAVGADDLCELIFTSGTTRKPKAVMLTHANCLRAGLDSVHCLWLEPGERCLTALPLFHVNAQAMSMLATLTVGGTLVLIEEFRASKFWGQVRRHEATQTALVAMQLRVLLAQPAAAGEREHRLRRLFYAINVTDAEKEEFEERYGVELINGYGLSEAMTLLTCAPVAGPRRWPSIGLPAPGRRLLLVDDDGNEVPTGAVGEIAVEGVPGRDITLGYYRDDEATAETMRGGRMHTGDNAYADEAGYLYFVDRKKDMIKRAGENVSAMEVEVTIAAHPGVAEAAVVGVADAVRDEAVAAVVVRTDGALTAEDVAEHCRANLASFKVPTVVTFVDELPKSSIGKVLKGELRSRLAAGDLA
jgi:carnitine-CoA ligase